MKDLHSFFLLPTYQTQNIPFKSIEEKPCIYVLAAEVWTPQAIPFGQFNTVTRVTFAVTVATAIN